MRATTNHYIKQYNDQYIKMQELRMYLSSTLRELEEIHDNFIEKNTFIYPEIKEGEDPF